MGETLGVEIRSGLLDDTDGIKAVHVAGWRQGYEGLFTPALIEREILHRCERWQALLDPTPPGHHIAVAEHSDRVIAFSHCAPHEEHRNSFELRSFYVHPEYWGRGVSTILISHVLSIAAERGFNAVYLITLEHSTRARAFYGRTGFKETGRQVKASMLDDSTVVNIEYVFNIR